MDKVNLKVEPRKLTGRKVSSLRREGVLPANIYGKGVKSQSIQVSLKDFSETYDKVGETGLLELELGKEKIPALIHNLQKDPVEDKFLHADFFQVNLKEKVTATVPVEVLGESPAEASGVGTVVLQLNELEVEALPTDLPEKFTIDASTLKEVDQTVKISDLQYDKSKVEVKLDSEQIVVKVEPPQKEEVIEAAPSTEGEAIPAEGGVEGEVAKEEAPEKSEAQPSESK